MRSDPRDVFLAMQKRWASENPEAIYNEKRKEDDMVRSRVHKMVEARFIEEERRKQTEAARNSPNYGKSKMFRPKIDVVVNDRSDENEGNVTEV